MAKLVHTPRRAEPRNTHFRIAVLAAPALAIALSACTRTADPYQGGVSAQPRASTLTPAPPPPVAGQPLQDVSRQAPDAVAQPIDPLNPNTPAGQEPVLAPVEVASATPSDGGKPVTRNELLGAWTVSSGGANCQIFLTLTKWSGGYRAASRACPGSLKAVQAWDVKGKQVVLVDQSGGTTATLFRSADSRYDGSTTSGSAISLSR
ncbi:protease inhibitor Inh/omp19 family protein [Ahrensia sp. R2A130]|uniref:protease inhibitor Inh/omp19 family protein n=1 Tax=Ahrensia sp. R2A130 TaxID=744979 RepID=UPI0001E0843C|nr:protease inhibitor Inh/omp19 family protein [Ahrensia sp. R2A130]EFL88087.1 putative Outer membrane lipoprotein Omp19-like protein [Ahrensia sp. R2A130]